MGDRIDSTSSGPIPEFTDDRRRDIIGDKQIIRQVDAIGGSAEPPTVATPKIPEPPQISSPPPLPALFGPTFSDDQIVELAKSAASDLLKKVTINGASPSFSGGNISFTVPQEPSASTAFAAVNTPVAASTKSNSPDFGSRDDGPTMRDALAATSARLNSPDFGSRDDGPTMRDALAATSAKLNSDDFGSRDDGPSAKETIGATSAKLNSTDFGSKDTGPSDSETAYAKGESSRKSKDRDSFDETSDVRQKGETVKEYKERLEGLEEKEKSKDTTSTTTSKADSSYGHKGFVPVALYRADKQKRILIYLDNTFSGVVEGATDGERTTSLPAETDYYIGGGSGDTCALGLYTKSVGTAENPQFQVWVYPGIVAGQLPSGMDPIEGKNIANGGSGDVWAEVVVNQTTGSVTSVNVTGGSNTPDNSDTSFYLTLGYYEYNGDSSSVSNYGCGSVDATICRNWFAAEAPFYGVTMTRYG